MLLSALFVVCVSNSDFTTDWSRFDLNLSVKPLAFYYSYIYISILSIIVCMQGGVLLLPIPIPVCMFDCVMVWSVIPFVPNGMYVCVYYTSPTLAPLYVYAYSVGEYNLVISPHYVKTVSHQ